ncbi:MAG: hypothetical protein HBSAPP03_07900 [Phycisphaerae bacterium]|nr:MAG: hypothetical protein HBSAPP03_07900 [Phycisphaerae bacterium]
MHKHVIYATLVGLTPAVAADVVVLTPSKDNTLYQSSTGALSNGKGDFIFSGRTLSELNRRALIAFDLSAVPPGATITGARLVLTMTRTISGPMPMSLHRVTASWGEGTSNATGAEGQGAPATPGDATWLHRYFSTSTWSTPGGAFVATPSHTVPVDGEAEYEWGGGGELIDDVEHWIANPSANHGWLLRGVESEGGTAKRFASREHPDPAWHPRLIVSYTTPATCNPDVNCDGAANGVDVEVQERAVGGELTDYCAPDPDFNQDGAVNGTDVEAVERAVGGGPCD